MWNTSSKRSNNTSRSRFDWDMHDIGKKIRKHPIYTILAAIPIIVALLAILTWVTGKQSLLDFLPQAKAPATMSPTQTPFPRSAAVSAEIPIRSCLAASSIQDTQDPTIYWVYIPGNDTMQQDTTYRLTVTLLAKYQLQNPKGMPITAGQANKTDMCQFLNEYAALGIVILRSSLVAQQGRLSVKLTINQTNTAPVDVQQTSWKDQELIGRTTGEPSNQSCYQAIASFTSGKVMLSADSRPYCPRA